MRHKVAGRKLSRSTSHRRALYRNLVTDILDYGKITTTEAKAKEVRSLAEKMITLAKRGGLHARRQALAYIKEKEVAHRLFGELKDRFQERQGGYLRIVKLGVRKGDGAPVSVIQLLPSEEKKKPKRKKKTKQAGTRKRGETKTKKDQDITKKKKNAGDKAETKVSDESGSADMPEEKAKDKK